MTEIHKLQSLDELAEATANYLLQLAQVSLQQRGSFSIALAGGTTPKQTYGRFADLLLSNEIDTTKLHVFWGDERCVPADDPRSNFHMAHTTLLSRLSIPADQVHALRCDEEPLVAAAAYEEDLRQHFEGGKPRFDAILLGLGTDGHTASLFPGSELLQEQERWVAAEFVEKIGDWRATLTPPTINAARNVAFLVQGEEKAEAVRRVIEGDHNPPTLPAQIIEPDQGELHWFLDQSAASMLGSST